MSADAKVVKPRGGNRKESSALGRMARKYAVQLGIVAVLLVLWVVFIILAPRTFLSYPMYNAFMSTTPYFALMAIPLTLVVITGEIDLSFPSIMGWGMCVFAIVFNATGSTFLSFIGALVAGAFAGWTNGLLVTKVGIPSLVATLGTQFFWRGLVYVLRNGTGQSLVASKGTVIDQLLVGRIADLIPMQFVWSIIFAIGIWFLLNRTKFGAHVYLVGDNQDSARLLGVDVDRIKTLTFIIVGVAAAFSGVVQSLDVSYFWPTVGEGQLLNTLASVFLGGTSVFGGSGTIFGTFIASYIIGSINGGIVAAGLGGQWTQLIYGFIIVVSVGIRTMIGGGMPGRMPNWVAELAGRRKG
jgi:simple sugar transport system permease protein